MSSSSKVSKAQVAARDFVREFGTKYFASPFDGLSDTKKSEALIRWYITQVLNASGTYDLTEEDVDEGMMDGSGDLGGDFYHETDDGTILIIQAKYRGSSKSEVEGDLREFAAIVDRLSKKSRMKGARHKLKDFLEEVGSFAGKTIDLRYVACAKIEGPVLALAQELEKSCAERSDVKASLCFLSEIGLKEAYNSAISRHRGLDKPQKFFVAKGTAVLTLPESDGAPASYVMVVPGKQLAEIYKEAKEALFELNIRTFLGNTKINQEMKETIQATPEQFYHFNNGITCLAAGLTLARREVTVQGLQVINGAQTVRTLFGAHRNLENGLPESLNVLVRVTIRTDKGYGADGKFVDKIVRYNNSQNPMKPADFISNDGIQKWLAKHFEDYKRFGKKVVYQHKRSSQRADSTHEIISLDDFAKSVYSFLYDPIKFSAGAAFFFSPGKEKGYQCVFGDGEMVYEEEMPIESFRLRSAIWWMSREFAKGMKADKATGKYGAALERKHFVLYAARKILERNYGAEYEAKLARFYEGSWTLDGEDDDSRWFRRLYEKSRSTVVYVFKKAQTADGESFNQRNWMRSPKTRNSISDFCETGPGLDLDS